MLDDFNNAQCLVPDNYGGFTESFAVCQRVPYNFKSMN